MRFCIDFPDTADGGRLRARFEQPIAQLVAWRMEDVEAVLRDVQAHAEAGRWCLGEVAYEAAGAFDAALTTHAPARTAPLARFAVFDHASPWDEAEDARPARCSEWGFSMSAGQYAERVAHALAAMAAGECLQINLTGILRARYEGEPSAWMQRLRKAQPTAYLLWLDWGDQQVLSASPELFFDWRPATRELVCRPMKGTAPRHADPARDREAHDHLLRSDKERAENVMIVDLLRNDLGRIAASGSVRVNRLLEVQGLPTVWQMTSTITAEARSGVKLADIFRALFPCGSVTGAPKAAAMQWIRQLEDGPRGVYCGALGVVRPGGAATFSVPIRTVALEREGTAWSARYGVGSGLTVYANAQDEWQELAVKSRLALRSATEFQLLETLRLQDGNYALVDDHLARLAASAAHFGFVFDPAAARTELGRIAGRHAAGQWRVRLLLDAGGACRTEAFALEDISGPVAFALAERPLETTLLGEFVRHKTTRREHYEARLRTEPGLFDTLLFNERGELTEFTRGNVALRIDGRWWTPALDAGLLPGVLRGRLIGEGRIAEAVLTVADLERAEEVAFLNSVRGWLRAEQFAPTATSASEEP